jgi:hypothetical protein
MKLDKHQVFTKVSPEFVCYEKSRVEKKLRVEISPRLHPRDGLRHHQLT